MSVSNLIRQYVYNNRPDPVHKGELERMAFEWNCEPSTVDRTCRQLVEDGILIKNKNDKGHMRYNYNMAYYLD